MKFMFINHEDQFQENIIQWHYHNFINLLIIEACEACDTCSFTKSVYLCSLTAFTHEIEATYWNLRTT